MGCGACGSNDATVIPVNSVVGKLKGLLRSIKYCPILNEQECKALEEYLFVNKDLP